MLNRSKITVFLALLGRTVHLFPSQSTASPIPAVSVSPNHELDCAGKQTAARRFTEAGNFSRAVGLLVDVYARCPSYENGRDLADAEIKAGQYENAKSLLSALLEQQDRPEIRHQGRHRSLVEETVNVGRSANVIVCCTGSEICGLRTRMFLRCFR